MNVYIVRSQIAGGEIWGVYADRATAQRDADEAEAQMDDDNYQHLVIEEWEVGVAWGQVSAGDCAGRVSSAPNPTRRYR